MRSDRMLAIGVMFLLAALGILFIRRWGEPPSSWDALTYHLDFAAHWLRVGRLETLHLGSGDPSPTYYPMATEQLYFWLLSVTHSDWWASFAQLPALLLGGLALGRLAREMGLSREKSAWAVLLWASTPLLIRQVGEAETEIWFAAWILCSIRFGLSFVKANRPIDLAFSIVALGIGIGSKYMGLLVLPTIALVLASSWRQQAFSFRNPFWKSLGTGILLAGFVGGWVYARNLITGGNPVLLMRLDIAGIKILPGIFDSSAYFGAADKSVSIPGFFLSFRGVLDSGVLLWLFVIGAIFAGRALVRGKCDRPRTENVVAAACIVTVLIFLFLIPYRQHKYFILPIALCAPYVTLFTRPLLRLGFILVNVMLSLYYVAKEVFLRAGRIPLPGEAFLFLLLAVVFVASMIWASSRMRGAARRTVNAAMVAGCLWILASFQDHYERSRFTLWQDSWSHAFDSSSGFRVKQDRADWSRCWSELAARTASRPVIVSYAGANVPYPLRGYSLKNQVYFVPATRSCSNARFFWGGELYNPSEESDDVLWFERLKTHGSNYVCVFRFEDQSWPREFEWGMENRRDLQLIWRSDHAVLFQATDDFELAIAATAHRERASAIAAEAWPAGDSRQHPLPAHALSNKVDAR